MPVEAPEISIIVVSYNTRELTLRCLEALCADTTHISAEIIVVDNASGDGSVEAIQRQFAAVKVIASQTNLGFAAGNNLGMKHAVGRLFLLINSDAFVQAGAIRAMQDYLALHAEVALVGPRILNANGSLQRSCYRFPSPWRAWAENLWISGLLGSGHSWGDYRRWAHDREQHVDWVIGACFMVRREVYDTIGGFDERFFMYAEETDWQRRMRDAGWEIGFTPRAQVTHLGGSSGAGERAKTRRMFFQSHDRYELKHYGLVGMVMARLATATGCVLRLISWSMWLVVRPQQRQWTRGKMRFASWLLVRQMTDWRLSAD